MKKRKKQAKLIRIFRKAHRTTGVYLFVLFFVMSLSGLALGWKKNSNGLLLPKSEKGMATDVKQWLPLHTLQNTAFKALQDSIASDIDLNLSRIDARPAKGIVKFIFKNHYYGVQLDGATGKVLAITKRRSDVVENIHDGSILDSLFNTNGSIFKLLYTSTMGLALLLFTITGFWLWYGPKKMKKQAKRKKKTKNQL